MTLDQLVAARGDRDRWHDVTDEIYRMLEIGGIDAIAEAEGEIWNRHGPEAARWFYERSHDASLAFCGIP